MAKGLQSTPSNNCCTEDGSTGSKGGSQKSIPWIEKPSKGSSRSISSSEPEKQSCAGKKDPEALCKDSGQARLEELGYKQELRREFGLLTSVAVGCSVMSFLLGITAELASSFPLAGGPYAWVIELTNNEKKYTLLAFCVGWFNIVGLFALTAGSGFLTAGLVEDIWNTAVHCNLTSADDLLIYSLVLLVAGAVTSMSTRGVKWFTLWTFAFLFGAGLLIIIAIPIIAPTCQDDSFVFLKFHDMADDGVSNELYLFLLGTLCAQYTFICSQGPVQFAEETKQADKTVPRAIMISIFCTAVLGFGYIVALLFCIQDVHIVLHGVVDGNVAGQIFFDIFQARYGNGKYGLAFIGLTLLATFSTTVVCMVMNARALWAFSRDGGVPLYRVWGAVNPKTGTPLNACWAMTAMAYLLGLPMLHSEEAFGAISSISSVGLYLSYFVPILFRIIKRKTFVPGPFKLGRAQPYLNVLSLIWIAISLVIFVLPDTYPIDLRTINYSPIAVGLVLVVLLATWFCPKYGAQHWYRGKAHMLHDQNVRGGGRYVDGCADYGLRAKHRSEGPPRIDLLQLATHITKQVQQMPGRVELAFSSDVATVERGGSFPPGAADSSKPNLPAKRPASRPG
ncbi:Amino-acid permease BAT1 homolog [Coccomyxa sp. Obi]|nr:Amino-acid permease BAT1 homolog [Coccomyxa sp. Obi]